MMRDAQFRINISLRHRRKPVVLRLVCLLCALLFATSATGFASSLLLEAQEPSGAAVRILKRQQQKEAKRNDAARTAVKTAASSSPASFPKHNRRNRNVKAENVKAENVRADSPGRRSHAEINVTFVATRPEVRIFLVGRGRRAPRLLGTTGLDNKLRTRLGKGAHSIRVMLDGSDPVGQQVEVEDDNALIALNYPLPPPPKTTLAPTALPSPRPTPTPTPTPLPAPPPVRPEAVIQRYLSPQTTESVTLEDWQQVLDQTRIMLEREQNSAPLKARELLASAQMDYLRGDYAKAIIEFKETAKMARAMPDTWLAAYGLANSYFASNMFTEAFAEYRHAFQLDSQIALVHKGLGDTLTMQREGESAIAYYDVAKKLGYFTPEMEYSYRLDQARLSKKKNCQQTISELLNLRAHPDTSKPTNALLSATMTDMGDCYEELNLPDKASDSYQQAINFDASNVWAYYDYGVALFKRRKYDEAVKKLEYAVKLFVQFGQEHDKVFLKRAMGIKEKAYKKLPKQK